MSAKEMWVPFGFFALKQIDNRPGVYELADKDDFTVYIGSARNLHARIEKHLMERPTSCIKLHAAMVHVEYRDDYELQEKNLRALFRAIFGGDPICN